MLPTASKTREEKETHGAGVARLEPPLSSPASEPRTRRPLPFFPTCTGSLRPGSREPQDADFAEDTSLRVAEVVVRVTPVAELWGGGEGGIWGPRAVRALRA